MANIFETLATSQVQIMVILVAIDVILGVIAAFMKNSFVLGKLAAFMEKGVIFYVFGFTILAAVGQAFPSLAIVVTVAYWLIVLALVGSILDNLGKIGIPIPKTLRK